MNRIAAAIAGLIATTAITGLTFADHPPTPTMQAYRIHTPVTKRRIWIVSPRVAQPARVVTRDTPSQQIHAPKRFKVHLADRHIYLDPQENYRHQGEYRIDENNHILVAQRLYNSLMANPVRVIQKNHHAHTLSHRPMIQPHMILMKPPDHWKNRLMDQPLKAAPTIPSVPRPPQKDKKPLLVCR